MLDRICKFFFGFLIIVYVKSIVTLKKRTLDVQDCITDLTLQFDKMLQLFN